jgi:hypothetical protein
MESGFFEIGMLTFGHEFYCVSKTAVIMLLSL